MGKSGNDVTETQQRIAAQAAKGVERAIIAYLADGDAEALLRELSRLVATGIRAAVAAAWAARFDDPLTAIDAPLPPEIAAIADALIAEQAEYLGGFADALAAPEPPSVAQIAARARLYTGAILAAYDAARWGDWVLPFRPRDLGTPCRYQCKCSAFVLDQGNGQGLYYYNLGAAEHCDGCVSRAQGSPYVVERRLIAPGGLRITG